MVANQPYLYAKVKGCVDLVMLGVYSCCCCFCAVKLAIPWLAKSETKLCWKWDYMLCPLALVEPLLLHWTCGAQVKNVDYGSSL